MTLMFVGGEGICWCQNFQAEAAEQSQGCIINLAAGRTEEAVTSGRRLRGQSRTKKGKVFSYLKADTISGVL